MGQTSTRPMTLITPPAPGQLRAETSWGLGRLLQGEDHTELPLGDPVGMSQLSPLPPFLPTHVSPEGSRDTVLWEISGPHPSQLHSLPSAGPTVRTALPSLSTAQSAQQNCQSATLTTDSLYLYNKKQKQIMKLKNIIAELKSSIENFIEGLVKQKKAFRKLEDRSFEIFQSEEQQQQQQKEWKKPKCLMEIHHVN